MPVITPKQAKNVRNDQSRDRKGADPQSIKSKNGRGLQAGASACLPGLFTNWKASRGLRGSARIISGAEEGRWRTKCRPS